MSQYANDRATEYATDPLFAQARLGVEAQTFLESNIGKHLVSRAEKQIEQYQHALVDADPFDSARIAHYQNKILVARAAVQWLAEAVNAGYAAEHTIREQEAYDE